MKIDIEGSLEIEYTQKVERFLRNKMSSKEASEFVKELKQNRKLREYATSMAYLIKVTHKVGMSSDSILIQEVNDDNSIYRTEKYLRCQMNEEEESKFKKDIREDKSLRNIARSMAFLYKHIKIETRHKDNELIETIRKEHNKRRIRRNINYISTIAASIIILFIADYQIEKYALSSLFDDYCIEIALESQIMRGENFKDTNIEKELHDLFSKIRSNDFKTEEVISKLNNYYRLSVSSYLNEYTYYAGEIGYYLALSYIKDNQKDKAIEVLEQLKTMYPSFKEAQDLYYNLKNIKGIF